MARKTTTRSKNSKTSIQQKKHLQKKVKDNHNHNHKQIQAHSGKP